MLTGDSWEPNFNLGNPKLRKVYIQAHTGLNKVICKQSMKNTIVILPMSDREFLPPRTHLSVFSFALKPGKPEGRLILDLSNLGPGEGQPLNNNKSLKQKVIDMYGEIHYPTLLDIVRMVIRIATKHGWAFIILWKDDLVGAYTLLNVHPDPVGLLCAEIMDGMLAFNTAMAFGGIQFALA
jgi:hypothetical protein